MVSLWKGKESLTKVAKFGPFPRTILYKVCLFYPSWRATSLRGHHLGWPREGSHCMSSWFWYSPNFTLMYNIIILHVTLRHIQVYNIINWWIYASDVATCMIRIRISSVTYGQLMYFTCSHLLAEPKLEWHLSRYLLKYNYMTNSASNKRSEYFENIFLFIYKAWANLINNGSKLRHWCVKGSKYRLRDKTSCVIDWKDSTVMLCEAYVHNGMRLRGFCISIHMCTISSNSFSVKLLKLIVNHSWHTIDYEQQLYEYIHFEVKWAVVGIGNNLASTTSRFLNHGWNIKTSIETSWMTPQVSCI